MIASDTMIMMFDGDINEKQNPIAVLRNEGQRVMYITTRVYDLYLECFRTFDGSNT